MGERHNGTQPRNRARSTNQRGVFAGKEYSGIFKEKYTPLVSQDRQALLERYRARIYETKNTQIDLGNKNLPVYKHKAEILATVDDNKAVLLDGPTGSGKSTQVPQYLFEAGYDMVVVLVPRRIIADNLYGRLSDELETQLGEAGESIVGVIHGERHETDEKNKILVMTPNTYVRMENEFAEEYGDKKVAITSDEIHEANLYTEFATGIAAMRVEQNDSWRIIASSATQDKLVLANSLGRLNEDGELPSVEIEGRPFDVDIRESPDRTPMDVYREVGNEHAKSMIFTSGMKEIDYIIDSLRKDSAVGQDVVFRKLHGDLSEIELRHINDPVPEGMRLVIVSSPAGNSGITIPGVTLVITDGTINREELDATAVPGLVRHISSQAEIIQQVGRAGRDVPGGVAYITKPVDYRLQGGLPIEGDTGNYSLEGRVAHGPAEIYSSNLGQVTLAAAAIGRRLIDVNPYLPHRVDESRIIPAEESIARLGALDDDNKITPIGRDMNCFPMRPELSRGVTEAWRRKGVTLQNLWRVAVIASAISSGGMQDYSNKTSKNWHQFLRHGTNDDFIAQLDIFDGVENLRNEAGYLDYRDLRQHDIQIARWERTQRLAKKVMRILKIDSQHMVTTPPTEQEKQEIRDIFSAGLIDYVYLQSGRNRKREADYVNILGSEEATKRQISNRSIASDSERYLAGFPRWYLESNGPKNIIELVMPVRPEVIGEHAKENGLLQSHPKGSRLIDGQVVELFQPSFGSIPVGLEKHNVLEFIPHDSQKLLVKESLNQQGETQRALRSLARVLDRLRNSIPSAEFHNYLRVDEKELLTSQKITELLHKYAKTTRFMYELDQLLRAHAYSENITLDKYITPEAYQKLKDRSPEMLKIQGQEVPVHYDKGTPYVINKDILHISPAEHQQSFVLADGRNVMIQVQKPDSRGTMRVFANNF